MKVFKFKNAIVNINRGYNRPMPLCFFLQVEPRKALVDGYRQGATD